MTDNNFSVDIKGFKEFPDTKRAERWIKALETAKGSPEVKNIARDNGIYIGSNFWHNLWIFLSLVGLAFFLWQVYDGKFLTSYTDNSICESQSNATSFCQPCQVCQKCGDCITILNTTENKYYYNTTNST